MKIRNMLLTAGIITLLVSSLSGCGTKNDNPEKEAIRSEVSASTSTGSPENATTTQPSQSTEAENENSQADKDNNGNKDNKETSTENGNKLEGFTSYENSTHKVKIQFPSDWQKQENYMGTVAAFIAPKEKDSDKFMENVNIVVQDLSSQPMTLKQYTDLSLAQLKKLITNSQIISSEETVMGGVPAQKLIYKGTQGEFNLRWMAVFTIQNNKAYLITFSAEENSYSKYSELAEKVINSFEFAK